MNTRTIRLLSSLIAAAASAGAAHADAYWLGSCATDSWYHCCDVGGNQFKNNWHAITFEGSCSGAFPGPDDFTSLASYTVFLEGFAEVNELESYGVFTLKPGMTQLGVHTVGTLGGTFIWEGGALVRGVFNVDAVGGAHMEIRGTEGKSLLATLNVGTGSTCTQTGGGTMYFQNSAFTDSVFNILDGATFDAQADALFVPNPGGTSTGIFNNLGTFVKSAGAGTLTFDGVPFNNSGSVDVQVGTLRLKDVTGASDGAFNVEAGAVLELSHTLLDGATITGAGLVRIPWLHILQRAGGGSVSIPNFELSGGAISGDGELRVTDTFDWRSGTIGNTLPAPLVTLEAGCVASISTSDGKSLAFGTLHNAGELNWSGGDIYMGPGELSNLAGGVLNVVADVGVLATCCAGIGPFHNAGELHKSAGAGTSKIEVLFDNAGLVSAETGVLDFTSFTQTAGVTRLAGGDIAVYPGSGPMRIEGGVLEGDGSVMGKVLIDGGELRPGLGVGTLAIADNIIAGQYTQTAAGTLRIEIAGTTPGTQHDQLVVTGVATLGGTLRVSLVGGFAPAIGDSFTILTTLLVDGEFDAKVLPRLPADRRWSITYGGTAVTLNVVAADSVGGSHKPAAGAVGVTPP
ncbi:MAG: hypothetical protein CHACPFDD_01601 [Phycisphaerae bacterium]|nr:hypothetical protein [Phycisphaerae bacterium]